VTVSSDRGPTAGDGAGETLTLRRHVVWDRPTRFLHWNNALLVFAVGAVGFFFMFRDLLHVEGRPSKIALKELHSALGYALLAGVVARLLWGFFGNRNVRYRAILPGRGTLRAALQEARALLFARPFRHDVGHGPLGKLSTVVMLALLLTLLATGVGRATTDLFHPPLGGFVAQFVAKPGVDPALVSPVDDQFSDPARLRQLNRVKGPLGKVHSVAAWALLGSVLLHVFGVILKDLRHGGAVVSSMVTGEKLLPPGHPEEK
jgi:cytochrome b